MFIFLPQRFQRASTSQEQNSTAAIAFKVPESGHSVEPTPKTWSVAGLRSCLRAQFDRTNPDFSTLICISFWLNDERVTATSMPPSIFFSFHPFANIWGAVLKHHAICFATREKAHYLASD